MSTTADEVYQGYPRGWFVVGFSEELGPGAVTRLHYFGQELAMFRGQDGEVRILDAYCPHLGAHLGVGGTVVDNTLRCPFHAWRFDGTGQCVEVPYAKKIPPRACVGSHRVTELNGMIFLWHARHGEQPDYEIPVIAECGSDKWTAWSHNILEIKTHPREIVENVADKAHFPEVHGTHIDKFENEFTDHMAIQRAEGIAYPRGGGEDRFKIVATYYGPGYQISEMASFLENRLVNCHTPIDEHRLHLRFGVMLKKTKSAERTAEFAAGYVKNLQVGFAEDVAIWENKAYRAQPVLCDGDGAIGKLRRWYQQFYRDEPAAAE